MAVKFNQHLSVLHLSSGSKIIKKYPHRCIVYTMLTNVLTSEAALPGKKFLDGKNKLVDASFFLFLIVSRIIQIFEINLIFVCSTLIDLVNLV